VLSEGVARKEGMHRRELFNENAAVIEELTQEIAQTCPNAFIVIVTNPINALVPVASEVMKRNFVYDPKKIFGCTTLDVVRTNRFLANARQLDPLKVNCPVVGGHSGTTMVPVISQCKPGLRFEEQDKVEIMTRRIQHAADDVLTTKHGPATLSMAYAASRFTFSLLRALKVFRPTIRYAVIKKQFSTSYTDG
jgi:NAD-dependent malate dehydrogenase